MKIPVLFTRGRPVFSFEFFQPKTPADDAAFRETVGRLKELSPDFVTITYGAAGSAREKTFDTAEWIRRDAGLETAAHLTCISHTRSELSAILDRLRGAGIENVVALRGDAPKDAAVPAASASELPYAADLVRFIRSREERSRGDFALAVAGYPETHPEAASPEEDLRRLKEKVDSGGDWVITQLFFDNAEYFAFVERARRLGITAPIVPGIMPVTSFQQTRKFTQMCGTRLPEPMLRDLAALAEDREAVIGYGIEYAVRQCRELLARGAPGIHFYTLNKSHSTETILAELRRNC